MGKKLNNFIMYVSKNILDCFRITKHCNLDLETYLFLFSCSIYDLRPLIFVGLNFFKVLNNWIHQIERVENREDFIPLIPYDLGLVDKKFFHTYTSNGYTQIKTNSNTSQYQNYSHQKTPFFPTTLWMKSTIDILNINYRERVMEE